jgi:hypothetical protein
MIRSTVKKVMWVGRATVFMVGLAVILALVLGVATTALGATGGNFILGKANNTASTPTGLISTLADAAKSALIVQNRSGGPALDLRVGNTSVPANDVAPMKVNSNKVVTNLNADKLDGRDSTELGQMWAVVRQNSTTDCTLLRGSGATGTTGNASASFCKVNFSRDLTNCAFIASLSEPGGYPGVDVAGEVWAFLDSNSTSTIAVRTADSAGAKAAKNFHVAVFC